MKQTVGNACGTIALLHAIFNNMDHLKIREDSFLARFYFLSTTMTPEERAELLENPQEGQPDIEHAHQVSLCRHSTADGVCRKQQQKETLNHQASKKKSTCTSSVSSPKTVLFFLTSTTTNSHFQMVCMSWMAARNFPSIMVPPLQRLCCEMLCQLFNSSWRGMV